MKRFIDEQRAHYGVEPICRILPIAPSTYYEHSSRLKYPDKRPLREKKDACLKQDIRRIYEENYGVYGVRKIWHQLRRDGQKMARCTVERLMKSMGLKVGLTQTILCFESDSQCPIFKVFGFAIFDA